MSYFDQDLPPVEERDYYTMDEIGEIMARHKKIMQELMMGTQLLLGMDYVIAMSGGDGTARAMVDAQITTLKAKIEEAEKDSPEEDRSAPMSLVIERAKNAVSYTTAMCDKFWKEKPNESKDSGNGTECPDEHPVD